MEEQVLNDLKKIHTADDTKRKTKEYYRQYYRENKERYKKRYLEKRDQILDKMKSTRQQKKKKSRGVFTIRHIKTDETNVSPQIEDTKQPQAPEQ